MSVCGGCNFVFHHLEDGTQCQKCRLLKPGLSDPELEAIHISDFIFYHSTVSADIDVMSTVQISMCRIWTGIEVMSLLPLSSVP